MEEKGEIVWETWQQRLFKISRKYPLHRYSNSEIYLLLQIGIV